LCSPVTKVASHISLATSNSSFLPFFITSVALCPASGLHPTTTIYEQASRRSTQSQRLRVCVIKPERLRVLGSSFIVQVAPWGFVQRLARRSFPPSEQASRRSSTLPGTSCLSSSPRTSCLKGSFRVILQRFNASPGPPLSPRTGFAPFVNAARDFASL
jgi:hypothetical protein